MKKYYLSIVLLFIFTAATIAQEGMWLLNQIDQLNLKEKGLEIDPSEIYNPDQPALYQAIVQLGGGTASFVSPEGLLITNHHVAYGALQRVSTAETDYLTKGFLASNRGEEINAPGYEARLVTEMTDVTDDILKAAKKATDPEERDKLVNEAIEKMTEKIEKSGDDIDARVAEMYNGKQYILFVYKLFKDIRLVYAPPKSIGKFGGDIDNWMWPRHTGDFSFMRVYVSPDGKGTDYSEDNIPYKPAVWLKVAKDDLKEGDLTFIVGFPGATTRYRTSNSARWNLLYNYPFSIENFGAIIALMDELTAEDPEGKLKVASLRAGLANAMKNYQGKVDGMNNTHFVDKKLEFEKEFLMWANNKPETREKYGSIIDDIAQTYKTIERYKDRDNVMGLFGGLSGTLYNVASQLYNVAREMEKPEKDRDPGYNDELLERFKAQVPFIYANYYQPLDKALLERSLILANDLPKDQRIEGFNYILSNSEMTINEFVDQAYDLSKLNDPEYAAGLIGKNSKELEALNDPFIKMAASVYDMQQESQKVYNKFAAEVTDLRKKYIDGLYEWKGEGLYPDANGTIRFTSGPVKGYSPEDAVWYRPFTSLSGVMAKDTGKEPFDVPAGLKALFKKKDFGPWVDPELKDVPVAFLHQCDITGGNSGSPVMNAKGEIIGVAFDGNYEAMISDWQYDFELQRTISVDIRYCLFITEKFGGAGFILDEMGVER
ncbi:MAG: S46 family peptidase [Bacteroidetes bacterium]|nr:S46 family peptidase [Bacteroidota bacterium]